VTTQPPDAAERAVRELIDRLTGQRIPAERELAERVGISRPRLRGVLARLRSEGLIETRQGSGTYAVAVGAGEDGSGGLRRAVILFDAALKLGDDPFFSLLLDRLQAAFQEAQVRCGFERFTADSPPPVMEDGAVTVGLAGQTLLGRQAGASTPLVTLLLPNPAPRTGRATVFQLDDEAAGEEAARRLVEGHGCRKILFFGRDDLPASRERRMGAEHVCGAAGVPFEMISCALNYAAGLAAGQALPPSNPSETGLIAANDWLAVGLRAGMGVGNGVPLVSFDGLPLTQDPALAIESLAVPLEEMARDVVAELRRLRRSPASVGRTIRYALTAAGPSE
jgi:hypothetical protein